MCYGRSSSELGSFAKIKPTLTVTHKTMFNKKSWFTGTLVILTVAGLIFAAVYLVVVADFIPALLARTGQERLPLIGRVPQPNENGEVARPSPEIANRPAEGIPEGVRREGGEGRGLPPLRRMMFGLFEMGVATIKMGAVIVLVGIVWPWLWGRRPKLP